MANSQRFEAELKTYERHQAALIAESLGKYALIHGDDLLGTWDTYEDALQAGYSKFGVDGSFLVKKVHGLIDGVQFFTRDVTSCRA